MPIREKLSRFKFKLKEGLGFTSRDVTPTPSSADLPGSVTPSAPPGSIILPTNGQDIRNIHLAPENQGRTFGSSVEIDNHPGHSDVASSGTPAQTASNDRHRTPSHAPEASAVSQPVPASPPQVVVNASNKSIEVDTDYKPADSAQPETEKRANSKAGVMWTGAKLLLQVVSASADAFPPLKSAVGGLNECINICERASKGRKEYSQLLERIDELMEELQGYLKDRESMEMTRSVERVCCELECEVENLKAKLQGPAIEQWLKAVDAPNEISECHGRIQRLLERLTLNSTMNILKNLNRQNEKTDKQAMEIRINRMSPAHASEYNSAASDEIRRGSCTQGTREPQIKSLMEWARAPKTGRTYWMNGMAGTGKTTIAYSVCSKLDAPSNRVDTTPVNDHNNPTETSMLAASFFCSRVIPECRQVKNIIPTIAYQLSRYSIPFRYALNKTLELDSDVSTRALKIQYEKLVIEPLKAAQNSLPSDFIVVIDALDECEHVDSLGEILSLLLSTPDALPIRFLVSSRPEPEISRRMEGRVNNQGNTLLVLHDLDADAVKADIALFMRRELHDVPLSDGQWSGLLERCGLLFIYASTACRFIKQEHALDTLDEAVEAIIGSPSAQMGRSDERAIDELYTTILTATLGSKSEISRRNKDRIRDVLETALCAAEPLKLTTLAHLLGFNRAEQVDALLKPLRSVLNVTTDTNVVTTLHASFPDYMFSNERSGEFHCQRGKRNLELVKACLHQIEAVETKFNLCGLGSSYHADGEVEGLIDRVGQRISPVLAYACQYWSTHLYLLEYEDQLVESVRRFFTRRLLVWMEVLNLTKKMRFGPKIIEAAEKWCSRKSVPNHVTGIVHDAHQFVSVYATNPVCQSTPHIYVSMLAFWPASRPVSITYNPRTAGMLEPKGTAIDRRQPALLATWKVSSGKVHSISLSTDGARIVAAADDAIDILDTSTGEGILHVQEPQTEGARTVAISPDGTRIAFGSRSGAYILDVKTCEITQLCPEQITDVWCVVFDLDGSRIAMGSESGDVFIYATQQAELVSGPIKAHTERINSVVFSHDGMYLASGSADKTIGIWDTKIGRMDGDPLKGHTDEIWRVSYSPDEARLASASSDGTIRVWDPQTGKIILGPLESHSGAVDAVAFSSNSAFIASGWRDGTIRVYDAHTGQTILGPLQGHTKYVEWVIFSPDGAQLFSCSGDGTIRLWNVQDRHVPTASHPDVPTDLRSVRYSPDGLQVVSGSADGTVYVWNVQTGEIVLGPLKGHTWGVYAVDYSPDGAYIASASWDSTLRIWSAQDGKDMHGPMQGHTGGVHCVRFSPDSSLVVSGSADKTVRVWDVATGQPVAEPLRGHSGSVESVTFSPNGSHVVSGSDDGTIRVWDIQTGQPVIGPLQGHEHWVQSVEFSRDGTRILSGSWDKSIRTWDAVTGQPLLVFGKDRGYIYSAAFSPDGSMVVSGSSDGTVCVWDGQSGDLILALKGHTDSVLGVQFSPDGSHVVSCSEDGTIRFWDVSSCRARVEDKRTKDDVQEDDASGVGATSQPWTLRDDGWVVDRQGQRLVWVPSDLQRSIFPGDYDFMIARRSWLLLNFDKVNVGNEWTKCYQS